MNNPEVNPIAIVKMVALRPQQCFCCGTTINPGVAYVRDIYTVDGAFAVTIMCDEGCGSVPFNPPTSESVVYEGNDLPF